MSTAIPPHATFTAHARATLAKALLRAGSGAKNLLRRSIEVELPFVDPPVETVQRYPVVAYFGDQPDQAYQLKQWLPVLEQVAARHPLVIVTRIWETAVLLRRTTALPVVFTRTLDGVRQVYEQVDVKTVIYVNNGMRNFQSLIYQHALHVHVNHGESDKISMVSNQAKAYDHVVVAGQAAVERHERVLINFDDDRLVVCGRPQLDLDVEPALAPLPHRRTVLYAPTWSGEDESNNYTSLDRYGVAIVRALLARDDVRLVYKPHPRVLTATERGVADAHAQIVQLVEGTARSGAPHVLALDADILGVFESVDLLVTDISSVGLDFLYLRPDAPIVLTDRRSDRERLLAEAPIAHATDVVDAGTVDDLPDVLAANLGADPHREARARTRDHYFGFARGESTRRFIDLVSDCIERRDAMVGGLLPRD